ncbi:MAG: hypothetical protein VR64_12585 [Desulfatitalea sp. BRH_c12]|nr:MAG: hypothetical protein VR64_12585 [Desulfatitalea sp. BRH_c12]
MNEPLASCPPLALPGLTGVRVRSFDLTEPFIDLAGRFAHLPGTVVLLSGGDLDCARYHIMGIWPWLTLRGRSGRLAVTVDNHAAEWDSVCLDALGHVIHAMRLPSQSRTQPLAAGLMGYLAYDLKDDLEVLPRTSVDDWQLPHVLLHAPALLVVHDKADGATQMIVPDRDVPGWDPEHLFQTFAAAAAFGPPCEGGFAVDPAALASNFDQAHYKEAVRRIVDYIAAGDVYQVNLSQRFQVPFRGEPFTLFRHLFERNPAPFFAFVQGGDHQIVSTSPERFLCRHGDRVETRPIKGTRPRGATPAQDALLRRELAASPKDDAELAMIVDLLRNDIGKVCRAGSVRVTAHKRLETYRNVHHLVSDVAGRLEANSGSVDLIAAAFPGGSITGCPKVRAMEIIDELETCRRHVYCGSIGYIGFDDTLDLSVAIRTATVANGMLCFSVGGGIVFDSDPQAEYEETLHKGHTLLGACREGGGATDRTAQAMVWCNGRLQPAVAASVPITDQGVLYGFGFFETIRVDQGSAPLLDGHLARFNRTWQALMPSAPPDLSWSAIIAAVVAANGLASGCAAVKLLATRGSRGMPPWDHTLLVSARPYTHRLSGRKDAGLALGVYPHARATPLAAHKTLNYLYYLQAGHWAQANGHDEALILNPDGSVSETNTANLLIVNGRDIIRPESQAVLPGVLAEAACRQLRAWGYRIIRQSLTVATLQGAEQVLATNALMGAVPVTHIAGSPRPAGDDLWRRINDALIPGWAQ